MTRNPRLRSVAGHVRAALVLPALAACAPLEPPPARPLPQPTLASVEYAHEVQFATDSATLTPMEAQALEQFVRSSPATSPTSVRVIGHADRRAGHGYNFDLSRRRAATVAQALRSAGVEPAAVTIAPMGEAMAQAAIGDVPGMARDRLVEVVMAAQEVVLPGCPDWTRDPGHDPLNLPLSNLGCANAVNLGLMVADPSDLATGHATTNADGTREADAILRYRTDKVRQLEADIIQ